MSRHFENLHDGVITMAVYIARLEYRVHMLEGKSEIAEEAAFNAALNILAAHSGIQPEDAPGEDVDRLREHVRRAIRI